MHWLMTVCFSWLLHPFYVSVTEVHHNAGDQALEVSIRIFTDDLENTLRMYAPGSKVDLINPPQDGTMDTLIKKYIGNKLRMKVNGSPRPLRYIGFERVDESVWAYFEVPQVPVLSSLAVHNPLLYEYKKEQINMVHVVNGKQRQSRKLDNPIADWEFKF